MNKENQIYELMTKMYAEMQKGLNDVRTEMQKGFNDVDEKIEYVKTELQSVKEKVIQIENEHGQKLGALFNGYTANTELLEQIAREIAKHEEIIFR
ncbi:MAG: hypothetical protein GX922_09290 [Firmicutes bacterium]|nr:hypothetical protein [Bacillota bacterium]